MANRTFKVYGQAYAEAGDVTATLTVGGVQVFNGAVNDSTTVRDGAPDTENHLFTFILDENTTGDLSYSLAVSGGELCLGPTSYNGAVIQTPVIPQSWFDANMPDNTNVSAEAQDYMADQYGEVKLGTTLYNKMKAGTLSSYYEGADADTLVAANITTNTEWSGYYRADDVKSSAQVDGQSLSWTDEESKQNWAIIEDGQTFTCTWKFSPATVFEVAEA